MGNRIRWLVFFVIVSILSLFLFPATSYAGTGWMKYFRKDTLLNTYMRAYAVSGDKLWVGTYGDGLVVYTGDETINYNSKNTKSDPNHNDGLLSDCITALTIDEKRGRIWIGTNEGLASCNMEAKAWERYFTKNGLPNDVIRDIAIDDSGNLWVGTPLGVAKYDGENWKTYDENSGLYENSVHTITVQNDAVWVATVGGSVSRYKDGEWKLFLRH